MATQVEVRGLKSPGTFFMVLGSVIGAVGALVFMVIAGDALGAEAFAPVGNAWNVFFIVATVILVPLEQYAVREASRGRDTVTADWSIHLRVGALATMVAVAVSWLGNDRLFQGYRVFPLLLGLMVAGLTLFSVVKGALAGNRRFYGVGWLLTGEAAFRLVALGVILVTLDVGPPTVAWSMVAAPLVALVLLRWAKQDSESTTDRSPALPFFSSYLLGSGAAQVLLAASPIVVKFLGADDVTVSAVTVTFTLFRAPLTLIFSLQGRLLSTLVRWAEAGEFRLLRVAAAKVVVGGLVLVGLAWIVGRLLGPEVVDLFYASEFLPSSEFAGWVAAGILAASTAQILGQLLVARGQTARLAGAWILALAVATATLFGSSGPADHRVAVAFAVGEASAMCAVGVVVLRTYRGGSGRPFHPPLEH